MNLDEMLADYYRKSRYYRFSLVALMLAIIAVVVLVAFKVDRTTQEIRREQQLTDTATMQARADNKKRQDDMTNYIQCILLLNKKYPDVNFQQLNYEQTKKYLVDCATGQ